jgi:outer membrane receptor protein involved in Fe transport
MPFAFMLAQGGKIAGRIMDGETNTPLPGVNVMVLETRQGAISDLNGNYTILNVPPGKHTLRTSMIGYAIYNLRDVEVNIDLTTTINVTMKSEAIQGEAVNVVATRPIVQKDIAASVVNISEVAIQAIPVQNITQVVGLRAGIVNSSTDGIVIRGGGEYQTSILLDGANLRDERSMRSYSSVSLNSLQEVQVQSSGFSAEYGNARSGVINVVTKEGDKNKYNFAITTQMKPPGRRYFGPSIYDPMSFWHRPFLDEDVCWTGTSNGAWDEFTQKQYVGFEGWIKVADSEVKDKDHPDLTPEGARTLYMYQRRRQGDIQRPDYNIDAVLGGPVPFVSEQLGNLRFFASYKDQNTMYIIPLATEGYRDMASTLKLTSDVTDKFKLVVSGMYAEQHGTNRTNAGNGSLIFTTDGQIASAFSNDGSGGASYIAMRLFVPDYWCPSNVYRTLASAKGTYIFSQTSLLEATLQMNKTKYFTSPNRFRDTETLYDVAGVMVDEGPWGFMPYSAPGLGDVAFRMGFGESNSRDYSRVTTYMLTSHYTSQLNESNQFKTGIEIVYNDQNVNYEQVELTLPTYNMTYQWRNFPIRGSIYAQDKLEFEGLVINAGVRMDYSNPNTDWYDFSDDPYSVFLTRKYGKDISEVAPKKETTPRLEFSPRLAISHPITENSKLYFNYGHFRALPSSSNLYRVDKRYDYAIDFLANPDLALEKTIQYELGYDHNLFDIFLLHLSAYYKDISEQARDVLYETKNKRVSYYAPKNISFADIRGFEVEIRKDRGDWINGFINYTYMVSTSGYFGSAREYQNPSQQREYLASNTYESKPRPNPYARANLEFRTPYDFGPEFVGNYILGDWRVSFLPTWSSGGWFTYNPGQKQGITYNMQWTDSWNVNLRITKEFKIYGVSLQLMADISNLTNRKEFSSYGFYSGLDRQAYFESLRLPKEIADELGAPYNLRYGNDKPGVYREYDTPYDPESTDEKTHAYIDMPNMEQFTFRGPRSCFYGIRIAFDF